VCRNEYVSYGMQSGRTGRDVDKPTLLLDETDTLFAKGNDLAKQDSLTWTYRPPCFKRYWF